MEAPSFETRGDANSGNPSDRIFLQLEALASWNSIRQASRIKIFV
jgi:hypothetical protein